MTAESTAEANGIAARYEETDRERRLSFERVGPASKRERTDVGVAAGATAAGSTAVVAQNVEGYAMLKVRRTVEGDELERYYGFDVALDHAAELLGASPHDLPIPDAAEDMGM